MSNKLHDYLRTNNIRNKDIAEQLGLEEKVFNNYVCDVNRISLRLAHNLCNILGCKPEDILEDELSNRYYKDQYPYNVIHEIMEENPDANMEYIVKHFDENLEYFFKTVYYDDMRDLEMLKLRYQELYTLQEIGDKYGLTRERVRQILDNCIARLKAKHIAKYFINGKEVIELEKELHGIKVELYKRYIDKLNSQETIDEFNKLIGEQDSTFFNNQNSINSLELSMRAYNCLTRANITTINDLRKLSLTDLLRIRNLGKKCVKEVLDKLHERGITLYSEFDPDEVLDDE